MLGIADNPPDCRVSPTGHRGCPWEAQSFCVLCTLHAPDARAQTLRCAPGGHIGHKRLLMCPQHIGRKRFASTMLRVPYMTTGVLSLGEILTVILEEASTGR